MTSLDSSVVTPLNQVTAQDLYSLIAPLDCPYAVTCPPTQYGDTCTQTTKQACPRYQTLILPYHRFIPRQEVAP